MLSTAEAVKTEAQTISSIPISSILDSHARDSNLCCIIGLVGLDNNTVLTAKNYKIRCKPAPSGGNEPAIACANLNNSRSSGGGTIGSTYVGCCRCIPPERSCKFEGNSPNVFFSSNDDG